MRLALLLCLFLSPLIAQRNELAISVGSVQETSREVILPFAASLDINRGTAYQFNYGLRLFGGNAAALYLENNVIYGDFRPLTTPLTTQVSSDLRSLYVVPGFRVKFLRRSLISPWVDEQRDLRIGTQIDPESRYIVERAIQFGGGVDVRLLRWLAGRFEVRDYYTGNPIEAIPFRASNQHNLFIGGGLVFRIGD